MYDITLCNEARRHVGYWQGNTFIGTSNTGDVVTKVDARADIAIMEKVTKKLELISTFIMYKLKL